MGVNGHAEGHGGGGDVPEANGTSEHYHVAADDQTLEEVRHLGFARHSHEQQLGKMTQPPALPPAALVTEDDTLVVPAFLDVSEQNLDCKQEFLAEEQPAVEEESYPEPTAAVDDVLEQVHRHRIHV